MRASRHTTLVRALRASPPLVAAAIASGCDATSIPVLDPDGPVALAERDLMLTAAALMLIVIVPVFVMAFWFARRYRASNDKARYEPDWAYSATLDAIVWLVPAAVVAVLGYLVWTRTHQLDPYRPLAGAAAPLEIEVVAQDWRWLFIYPEQDIATVNELVFPAGRPLRLKLTSDTVMNSFYVAGLGGQIFAMAGMRTELNLRADAPAQFIGRNMQYSGKDFSDQHFAVRAETGPAFAAWVAQVRQSPLTLDTPTYASLAKQRGVMPVTHYSGIGAGLFAAIIAKYGGRHTGAGHAAGARDR
jgi:cytochrome o ubiquinol oxidase subunit 2